MKRRQGELTKSNHIEPTGFRSKLNVSTLEFADCSFPEIPNFYSNFARKERIKIPKNFYSRDNQSPSFRLRKALLPSLNQSLIGKIPNEGVDIDNVSTYLVVKKEIPVLPLHSPKIIKKNKNWTLSPRNLGHLEEISPRNINASKKSDDFENSLQLTERFEKSDIKVKMSAKYKLNNISLDAITITNSNIDVSHENLGEDIYKTSIPAEPKKHLPQNLDSSLLFKPETSKKVEPNKFRRRSDTFDEKVQFESINMPFCLALSTKMRRNIIAEIKGSSKDSSIDSENVLKNIVNQEPLEKNKLINQIKEKEKKKKMEEYSKRDIYSKIHFDINSMDKKSKENVKSKLKQLFPQVSRFVQN